jgi:hypothetical protein
MMTNLYYSILRLYHSVVRFFYYGYHGAKYTRDYDANGSHSLIYAHMKRVKKFMNSDETHLLWNDKPDNKGMKLLAEFTELARRMGENDMSSYYNYHKFKAKYPDYDIIGRLSSENRDRSIEKEMRLAFKRDREISSQLTKRYYYLLENKMASFWD